MADVFLSYAREDSARARQVAEALDAAGYQVFWDAEIPPGQSWADVLAARLDDCKCAIVLWSAASTQSQYVREEARLARDRGKLIPAQLDATPPPFGFGELQAADLSGWTGAGDDPHWRRVLAAVDRLRAAPPPTPRRPAARGAKRLPPWLPAAAAGVGVTLAALIGLGLLADQFAGRSPPPAAQSLAPGAMGAAPNTQPNTQPKAGVSPAVRAMLEEVAAARKEALAAAKEAQAAAARGANAFALASQGAPGHGQFPFNAGMMMSGDLEAFRAGRPAPMVLATQGGDTFSGLVSHNGQGLLTRMVGVNETPAMGLTATGITQFDGPQEARYVGVSVTASWRYEGASRGAPGAFTTSNVGVVYFADGRRFEGAFEARGREMTLARQGLGALYDARGAVIEAGRFENDVLVGAE